MSPVALRRQMGELLVAGFDGTSVPVELDALARQFGLGGAILFARNVSEPAQVADLAFHLARLTPDAPAWVSVDQEGGRVARLKRPFTEWPPMATLGRSGDEGLARRVGQALAAELRAVGVTLDYAPVLDVHTNPSNPVIGDRALSTDATVAARLGAVLVQALQDGGVAACGKHFPGHGDTSTDSHHELPLVEHPIEQLRVRELLPFRAAIDAGVATLMTAHVFLPALDETRPATLSRRIVHGLLRETLGYDGVVLSDDLEMKALSADYAVPEAAVLAIEAGCDGVLVCSSNYDTQAATIEALIYAVETGRLALTRVEEALARIRRAKARWLPLALPAPRTDAQLRALLGCEAHQRVADEMARFV